MKQILHGKGHGLLWQMVAAMVATAIPLGLVISLLFSQASKAMQQSWDTAQQNNAHIISAKIDDYIEGIYSTSDAFALDPRMTEKLDADYTDRQTKLLAIQYIKNNLFVGYNQLQDNPQISAVYNNANGQLFNLLDPSQDETKVLALLRELRVNASENLGKFCWYPLQNNLFQAVPYYNIRKDRVLVGSRRIYSPMSMQYPYIHIFAIQEQQIYNLYADIAQEAGVDVYLLDENGNLISSTQEFAVASGKLPDYVQAAQNSGFADLEHNIYRKISPLNGWQTILVAPQSAIETQMQFLYTNVLWIVGAAIVVAVWLIARLYHRFTAPLSKVAKAMKQVDSGDLTAYVLPSGDRQIRAMMETYNDMLESLNRNLDARLQLERKRKELEMQVLTTQINPHFLYNTLETIVWSAGEAGRPDIGRLAASLGKLYRLSISGGVTVLLRQELAHLQAYLNIQKSRTKNAIEYRQKIPAGLPDTVSVIKLTLQPIAENSILHAMPPDGTMTIRIKAAKRQDKLIVWITDNGTGMDRKTLLALRAKLNSDTQPQPDPNQSRKSTGIGLWNIAQRMNLYLGSGACVKIYSKKGVGTCVKLVFPQTPPEIH